MNYDRKGRLFPSSFLFFLFLPRYTWPQYGGVTRISSMYHFPAVHFSWHTWEHASPFRSQIFVKISKPSTLFFNPLDMEYLHFRNFFFNRVLIQFDLYNINFNDTLGKNIIIRLKNCFLLIEDSAAKAVQIYSWQFLIIILFILLLLSHI